LPSASLPMCGEWSRILPPEVATASEGESSSTASERMREASR
jgi:hypothetical protein